MKSVVRISTVMIALLAASRADAALVGHWTFDSAADRTADSSGNGLSLSQVGTVSYVPGVSGDAMNVNGGGKFNRGFSGSLSTSELTISLWADIPDTQTGFDDFWAFSVTPTTSRAYVLEVNGTDQRPALFNTGLVGSPNVVPNNAQAPDLGTGGFHHLAFTASASSNTVKLFVDGVLAGSNTWSATSGINFLTIGGQFDDGVRNIFGVIDDVQVYNTALRDEDVRFLFSNPGSVIVPEPASLSLMAMAGLAAGRRRRKA